MVDTNAEPDLEKCSPSTVYSVRREKINEERPPSHEKRKKIDEERPHAFACENRENIDGELPSISWRDVILKEYGHAKPDSIDKARQCCFLCLQSQNGPYAIEVPCRRPEIGKEEPSPFAFIKPKKGDPTENASESDAVIWNRMLDMYYEMHNWKRWLPFYGPVSVKEVEFTFFGAKDQDGLYKIYDVKSVDIERVKNIADYIIEENEACNDDAKITMEYCDGYMHNSRCPVSKYDPQLEDFVDPPTCIQEEAAEANERKRKISMLETEDVLKECARNPQKANGQGTLDGMAQDSCIYNTKDLIVPQRGKPYRRNERMRGIEMRMGWQIGPKALAWSALGMAIISICIVAWGEQSKDWGNAMAFGQLLAAFLAIIITSARD